MPVNRPLQIALLAFVAAGLLWPVIGDRVQAAISPNKDGCPQAGALPSPESRAEGRAAVLCLLNRHRAEHKLKPLRENPQLEAAAQAHAEDMGRRDFYAHENPDNHTPADRIKRAGYRGRTSGENIHWGVRINSTPAQIVRGWMASPGHRENILRSTFSEVGTGIGYDAPEPLVSSAAVYVNNFGG